MQRDFVRASDIADVAALVALHGPTFRYRRTRPICAHLQAYWRLSKVQHERWRLLLARIQSETDTNGIPAPPRTWKRVRGLAEELFAYDLVTRTWSTVLQLMASDPCEEIATFSQSVFFGQLEIRQQLLEWMLDRRGMDDGQSRALDRVRRATERWTDLLLGILAPYCDVRDFAFDEEAALDFSQSLQASGDCSEAAVESLIRLGIGENMLRAFSAVCPHPRLNREISLNILSCFGGDLLGSAGPCSLVWQTGLQRNTEELARWLNELHWELTDPR